MRRPYEALWQILGRLDSSSGRDASTNSISVKIQFSSSPVLEGQLLFYDLKFCKIY
jgi:hypothetical protein